MKIRQDWYDIDREDEENIDAIIEDEDFEIIKIDTDQTSKDNKEGD